MPPNFLRLPDRKESGPWQMAADDWMLGRAESGECLLRVYEFREPTATLGYFQPSGVARSSPAFDGLPWVRRQTGGDLLVHDRELTYSVAVPEGKLDGIRDLPCRVHKSVAEWLSDLGIETACQPAKGVIERPGAPSGVLCFLHPAAGDVVCRGSKVMGSAQRKRRGAVLQHGGLLLGTSPRVPWLPGLAELGAPVSAITLDGLCRCLEKALGCEMVTGAWDDEAEEEIRRLEETRYRNPQWNESR
ncbi:MAG: lipoate--protein ligase family protein [Planctomycetes bacterium]|nr:lipoate--protein ligase family protein [Planctomycetota bacterium]